MARRTLLPLAAVACLGCAAAAGYVLVTTRGPTPAAGREDPGWMMGLDELLRAHGGAWPPLARALLGGAGLFALLTALWRVERSAWRTGLSAALAWGGLGILFVLWAISMPARIPPLPWALGGLGAGVALGLFAQWFLGFSGGRQAVRDAVLCAVFGYALALALEPLVA